MRLKAGPSTLVLNGDGDMCTKHSYGSRSEIMITRRFERHFCSLYIFASRFLVISDYLNQFDVESIENCFLGPSARWLLLTSCYKPVAPVAGEIPARPFQTERSDEVACIYSKISNRVRWSILELRIHQASIRL
jgi:hypothetical protein